MQTGNVFYAVLSGLSLSFLLFNLMHDASHGSLSKNPQINYWGTLFSSFLWWNPWTWLNHHVLSHHSYTGIFRMDPDIVNAAYWIRKHEEVPKNVFTKYQPWLVWFLLGFLPGQHIGQVILYNFADHWTKLCNPNGKQMPHKMWIHHISIVFLSLLVHICLPLYFLPFVSTLRVIFVQFSVLGLLYFVAVAPNHDQQETASNNNNNSSKWGVPKQKLDWGEQQVRASGNHSTSSFIWGPIFNCIFGGLNYQIEHHLFPAVSHSHFPDIQPVIQQTCKEFEIPYNGENSFIESLQSFQGLIKKHSK